jgi:hypothetical protein
MTILWSEWLIQWLLSSLAMIAVPLKAAQGSSFNWLEILDFKYFKSGLIFSLCLVSQMLPECLVLSQWRLTGYLPTSLAQLFHESLSPVVFWSFFNHNKGKWYIEISVAYNSPLSWEDASERNHFLVSYLSFLDVGWSRPGSKSHPHLQGPLQEDKNFQCIWLHSNFMHIFPVLCFMTTSSLPALIWFQGKHLLIGMTEPSEVGVARLPQGLSPASSLACLSPRDCPSRETHHWHTLAEAPLWLGLGWSG